LVGLELNRKFYNWDGTGKKKVPYKNFQSQSSRIEQIMQPFTLVKNPNNFSSLGL